MKQEWVYTWETVPGNGVVTQTYPTREEAGKPWIKSHRRLHPGVSPYG